MNKLSQFFGGDFTKEQIIDKPSTTSHLRDQKYNHMGFFTCCLKHIMYSMKLDEFFVSEIVSLIEKRVDKDYVNKLLLSSNTIIHLKEMIEDIEEVFRRQKYWKQIVVVQSCFRRWKVLQNFKDLSPLEKRRLQDYNSVFLNLISSEKEYTKYLNTIKRVYISGFRSIGSDSKLHSMVQLSDINTIFGNIEHIIDLHNNIYKKLDNLRNANWPFLDGLADIFHKMLPSLSVYNEYMANYQTAVSHLERFKRKPRFSAFLNELEQQSGLNYDLRSLLAMPSNRIPAYELIIESLANSAPFANRELEELNSAYALIKEIIGLLKVEFDRSMNSAAISNIQRSLVGCPPSTNLRQVNRKIVAGVAFAGPNKKSKKRQLFVFNDSILITKPDFKKDERVYKFISLESLEDAQIIDVSNSVGNLSSSSGGILIAENHSIVGRESVVPQSISTGLSNSVTGIPVGGVKELSNNNGSSGSGSGGSGSGNNSTNFSNTSKWYCCFEFRPKTPSYTKKPFLFCAKTPDEKQLWIQSLRMSVMMCSKNKVFKLPLSLVLKNDGRNSEIPHIVEVISQHILEKGILLEGIFRVSGNATAVDALHQRFGQGKFSIEEDDDTYELGTLLKTFFRELPEPLIPSELYEKLITLQKEYEQECNLQSGSIIPSSINRNPQIIQKQQIQNIDPEIQKQKKNEALVKYLSILRQTVNEEIPKINRTLLKYVISFLVTVADYSSYNRMDPHNLSVVFGPNLLWPKQETIQTTLNLPKVSSLVLSFIEYHSVLLSSNIIDIPITIDMIEQIREQSKIRKEKQSLLNQKLKGNRPTTLRPSSRDDRASMAFQSPLISVQERYLSMNNDNDDEEPSTPKPSSSPTSPSPPNVQSPIFVQSESTLNRKNPNPLCDSSEITIENEVTSSQQPPSSPHHRGEEEEGEEEEEEGEEEKETTQTEYCTYNSKLKTTQTTSPQPIPQEEHKPQRQRSFIRTPLSKSISVESDNNNNNNENIPSIGSSRSQPHIGLNLTRSNSTTTVPPDIDLSLPISPSSPSTPHGSHIIPITRKAAVTGSSSHISKSSKVLPSLASVLSRSNQENNTETESKDTSNSSHEKPTTLASRFQSMTPSRSFSVHSIVSKGASSSDDSTTNNSGQKSEHNEKSPLIPQSFKNKFLGSPRDASPLRESHSDLNNQPTAPSNNRGAFSPPTSPSRNTRHFATVAPGTGSAIVGSVSTPSSISSSPPSNDSTPSKWHAPVRQLSRYSQSPNPLPMGTRGVPEKPS